ncbi:MAG: Hint domain-containing protein [Cypionkella sp.]
MTKSTDHAHPGHAVQVLAASAIYCVSGVNIGDALDHPDLVCLGDIYGLDATETPQRMVVSRNADGAQQITVGSAIGDQDDPVLFEARYTLMAADGDLVEILLLALPGDNRFALPLSPMTAQADYTLLKIDPSPKDISLSDLLCISFARGTMITLASGAQRAIEDLATGDRVLTRDHGGQEIRWVGKATLRAVGAFAPVLIEAGTLGNSGDLIVSQHHRMFLYQRQRKAGQPTAELLVQAKHLVDGERIFLREGGYIDFFSLVFDHHEIIYAEGIPAESLMVNDATVSRLPPELSADVRARFPGLSQNQHFGTEAGRSFLSEFGTGSLFKAPARGRPVPER